MGNGWMGKIIRVNLTDETVKTEPLNKEDARLYAGGRGLGAKYCVDRVSPKADPLGPENVLAFMTGPLTGTLAPCAGMTAVVSKVPQNWELGSCVFGGYFGPELKFAGFDGIIVEGKAKNPVYLFLNNDHIEIRTAGSLWGRTVPETAKEILKATGGDAKIACIGPSGERLDLSAVITSDRNSTAESLGLGAVMGSKNLKAIAVRGTHSIQAAKNQEFLNACLKARKAMKEQSASGVGHSSDIPGGWLTYLAGNWKRPCFSEDNFGKRHPAGNGCCFGCFPSCGTAIQIEKPQFTGFDKILKKEMDWSFEPDSAAAEPAERKSFHDFLAFVCSVGICPFATTSVSLRDIAGMYRTCTGFDVKKEEILQIGERIRNLEASFHRNT